MEFDGRQPTGQATTAYTSERSRNRRVEEVQPSLKTKNKVGHTSSTLLNSCSFQRYRLLFWNLYSILLTQALHQHIHCILFYIYHETSELILADSD